MVLDLNRAILVSYCLRSSTQSLLPGRQRWGLSLMSVAGKRKSVDVISTCIVGVEGPVCSGKTSTLRAVSHDNQEVLMIDEYYEMLGCRRFNDLTRKTGTHHQRDLLRIFASCERERMTRLTENAGSKKTVLLDRTYFSVAAWSYAVSGGHLDPIAATAMRYLRPPASVAPDIIYFADIPHEEMVHRAHLSKFDPDSPALSRDFNMHTRRFFRDFASQYVNIVFVSHHELRLHLEDHILVDSSA